MQTLTIANRFNGPPDSGNGGYVCGLLARGIDGPAESTLRLPPPLDVPLQLHRSDAGVALRHGELLIGESRPAAPLDLELPPAVSLAEAEDAVQRFAYYDTHYFPTCFVCGPGRDPGDGLRLFTGQVAGREAGLVASPWHAHSSLADSQGRLAAEFVWSALDCPGAFAIDAATAAPPKVLGRLHAQVHELPVAGRSYVAMGWYLGCEGRKHYAGTAIADEAGAVLGVARAVWIELKESPPATG